MQNKFLIIIVVSVILSSGFGYWLGQSRSSDNSALAELEKSRMISSWMVTVSGEIGGISGETITLLSGGETMDVAVVDRTVISLFIFPEIPEGSDEGVVSKSERREIAFENLKVGDNATILAGVKANGKLEASSVNIFEETVPAE
jgi:hypothetical protein